MRAVVTSVADARAEVVERLHARRDEVVREIFARVQGDAFARAGGDDAEYVAGLRAAVAAAVEYGLEGIEQGGERIGPVPPVALEQARRAARVGVSLDTVLRRYVMGHTLLEEFVMEEADRGEHPGGRSALREVLRAQASVLDRLLAAITAEYGDELARTGRTPEQRRAEGMKRLLAGDGHGAVEGAELDYDFEWWHLGVIAVGRDAALVVKELAARVDRRLLSVSNGEQSVWAWLGGRGRFACAEVERVIAGLAGERVALALGEPAQGLEGWRLTHQQAQAALVVALRRPRPFTRYADVALLATALKDDALARALVEIYLSPLDDHRGSGQVLRETLRAYLAAECQASSAAVELDVARSTVAKRLRMIEEKLGRTLHPCPAELEVALLLSELNVFAAPEISTVG